MRRMVAEIDSTQFQDELFNIKVAAQVSQCHRSLNQLGQKRPPSTFHSKDFLADRTLDVIELEHPCGHRTSARQSRALSPAKPALDQRFQTRKPFRCIHGGVGGGSPTNFGPVYGESRFALLPGTESAQTARSSTYQPDRRVRLM